VTAESARELGLHLVSEDLVARRVGASYTAQARQTIISYYRWAAAGAIPDIRQVTPAQLLAYRDWLSVQLSKTTGAQLRHTTVNERFGMVRLLYACLYRSGLIEDNPAGQLDTPLSPEPVRRRELTEKEIKKFLDELDTTTAQGLRDRSLFELVYAAGLRVGEAAGLKVGDVDFERRIMRVRGKGDKDRLVPISEVARDVLLLYLGDRVQDPQAWIFTGTCGPRTGTHVRPASVSERFRTLLRRFGMDDPDLSAHSVRHATATHLLDHGVSVRQVQELLGHATVETTARYTHVVTENLKRIYRRYHPREQAIYEEVDKAYRQRLAALAGKGGTGYDRKRGKAAAPPDAL
jgi:site-specific recombinase XerD